MKRQLFLSMFAMLSVATFAQTPATTNINKSGFPKIMPDNSIEFAIKAPEARNIQLDLGKRANRPFLYQKGTKDILFLN